ncbi:BatA domain-containing protein [Roseiconus lacunae]|uniref:BatA domain-containing protein n=1 Tax=Roseiconus lacunae TaxID=2605694 RepID=A0ABT7PP11_9BACT|nr:BatA domain-containing protein [Roseiconus lacunae]MDM4018019.1 BatA domain-containing protein [Roseiconus lacunae]
MNLLNGVLALGAFAFSIPLLIHLFFRSRFTSVDWGAMHLLQNVIRVNRRRMQVTNLLLLLLRCLIPVALAFCLARPVWTGLRALAGDAPKTLVIALDDSRSLSVTPPGDVALIETAKEELREILAGLSRRDEVMLVRSSRIGAIASKMGVSEAIAKLRRVDATGSPVTIGQLMDAAMVASQDASHPRRQILVVSDFQEVTMGVSTLETAQRVAAEVATAKQAGVETIFDFLNVQPDWEELHNVSVDAVTVESPVVVSQRTGVYSVTVRNAGETPANDVRLVWAIDGRPLDPRSISIDAKSSVTNRLTQTIDEPGGHQITAMIDRADMMVDDNRRSTLVNVMPKVNVLLIDGQPSRNPLGGAADYLAIALSPFSFGGDDRPDPIKSTVVPLRRLNADLLREDPQVVVLANVDRVPDGIQGELVRFVHRGGGLVIFDGPNVRPETYNLTWTTGATTDGETSGRLKLVFPAELGEVVGASGTEERDIDPQSGEVFAIDRPNAQYEPWKFLVGDNDPFSDVSVTKYRELKLTPPDGESVRDQRVLLQTTEGDPIAISQSIGEGSVVQFAISGNDRWTNWPLRPIFLPMIGQMVLDLAGQENEFTVSVGQPIVVSQEQFDRTWRSDTPTRWNWVAETPAGEINLPRLSAGEPVRITETYEAGLYSITRTSNTQPSEESKQDDLKQTIMRLAEVDASESILNGAGGQQFDRLRETLQAGAFETAGELSTADRSRSFGREVWRWLWLLVVIGLIAELWVQQNILAKSGGDGGLR